MDGRYLFRAVRRWVYMVVLVLIIAAYGRDAQPTFVEGIPYHTIGKSFWDVLVAVFKAPYDLLHPAYYKTDLEMLSHAPISLFYVAYAFVGSYGFGILKGMADVFWRRRPSIGGFRACFGCWMLSRCLV